MADDEQESRPADWEVVQLTASTYAAAPGPEGISPGVWKEPDYSEIHREAEYEDVSTLEEDGGTDIPGETISRNNSDDDRSASVKNFEEGKGLRELNLIGEGGGVDVAPDNDVVSSQSSFSPKCTKDSDGDEYDGCGLPCIEWWKRHVACLYRHAKDANTFWSVFVAAALVGLVILGSSASKKNGIFSK